MNPQQGLYQDPWAPASTGSSALYNAGTLSWNAALLGSAVEQPITAANQTSQIDAAHPVTVNLLANAIDPNPGETLTVTGVDLTGTKGAVVLNSNGTASYTPGSAFATLARGQTATDIFHYTISNGKGQTSTAADTVTITGVEQPIAAAKQTAQTDAAHAVTVNLLANAIDPNLGDTLTVTGVDLTGRHGFLHARQRLRHIGNRSDRDRYLPLHDLRRAWQHQHGHGDGDHRRDRTLTKHVERDGRRRGGCLSRQPANGLGRQRTANRHRCGDGEP